MKNGRLHAPSITGWYHGKFGKRDNLSLEGMIVKAVRETLLHAELDASDIDEVVVGHFNAGFSKQDFTASLALQADDALRFLPATRVENACATGSAAVHQGVKSVQSNNAHHVLVVGVEQMTKLDGKAIGQTLLKASYLPEDGAVKGGFAGVFGNIAQAYFERYGNQERALAQIAAKNHANGVRNPFAQMRKDLGFEFCLTESEKNPFVAGPLKRTDCSLVSDGVAALVISSPERAKHGSRAIAFRGLAHCQDFLPMSKRDILRFEGCQRAWQVALNRARVSLDDLSLVETHDCFTIAELIEYEAMGLADPGRGYRLLEDGATCFSGRLPVNPSGGLKAKGHPIGATGVSMHVLCAMQLMDEAGEMQVPNANLAALFNMGGAAVANYVSILERIH